MSSSCRHSWEAIAVIQVGYDGNLDQSSSRESDEKWLDSGSMLKYFMMAVLHDGLGMGHKSGKEWLQRFRHNIVKIIKVQRLWSAQLKEWS